MTLNWPVPYINGFLFAIGYSVCDIHVMEWITAILDNGAHKELNLREIAQSL